MPIYEFQCEECNRIEEHFYKNAKESPLRLCHCGGTMDRIMSKSNFKFSDVKMTSGEKFNDIKEKSNDINKMKEYTDNDV